MLLQQLLIKNIFIILVVLWSRKNLKRYYIHYIPTLRLWTKMTSAIFVTVKGEFQSTGVSIGEDISRMANIEVVVDKFE
jgi:hypothetical protein